jgi:hypothetical protein
VAAGDETLCVIVAFELGGLPMGERSILITSDVATDGTDTAGTDFTSIVEFGTAGGGIDTETSGVTGACTTGLRGGGGIATFGVWATRGGGMLTFGTGDKGL